MDLPGNFLSRVDAINKKNYNYGNEVLYRFCGFDCLKDPGKLSSAIWLIGKSYSADPTRSAPKDTFKNKGLGSSFERIATELLASKDYKVFCEDLEKLHDQEYHYDDSDLKLLEETIKLVNRFNAMIKNAMNTVAKEKISESLENESHNVVSFCSKFLHFMCPHLFFIFDSYSRNGGHTLFSTRAKERTLYIQDQKEHSDNLLIDTSIKAFFNNYYTKCSFDLSVNYNDYRDHCLRAYSLARFLHENHKECARQIADDPHSCYMPRLVDSILMRITD